MTDPILRQALAYARRGWPVFPCLPGQKIPATTHGFRDATTDEQQITAWFARHPGRNLAIATGAPGPDVLDVDQHGPAGNGFAAFARLRRAGLLTGASRLRPHPQRRPARLLHRHRPSATATCPPTTWTSGPHGGYVLAPPSQVGGHPYQLLKTTGGHGRLDWHAVTRLLQPQRQHQQPQPPPGPGPRPRPAWPAGSPPSPKATATPACSGPPTAPWKPTRPPT